MSHDFLGFLQAEFKGTYQWVAAMASVGPWPGSGSTVRDSSFVRLLNCHAHQVLVMALKGEPVMSMSFGQVITDYFFLTWFCWFASLVARIDQAWANKFRPLLKNRREVTHSMYLSIFPLQGY